MLPSQHQQAHECCNNMRQLCKTYSQPGHHEIIARKPSTSYSFAKVGMAATMQGVTAYIDEPNWRVGAYQSMQPMITIPKHRDPAKRGWGISHFTEQY